MVRSFKKQKTVNNDTLYNIVEKIRKNRSLELEIRLGKIVNDSFISGIDHDLFEEIYKELMNCEGILKEENWKETMDIFFINNGQEYRTRVTYPNTNMLINTETIIKRKIDTINIKTEGIHSLRLSLSEEEETRVEDIPMLVEPIYVRLKHIKRFYIVDGNTKKWSIDLSKTWEGSTRTEAEDKQHNDTPKYEVECELIDTELYLDSNTNKYIIESIIMKGIDLLGNPDSVYYINNM